MTEIVEFGDERLPERLWAKASVDPERGCWLWQGMKHASGYGLAHWGSKKAVRIHRLSHEIFIGPIPDGYVVHHWCEVRNCFNPAHLEAVTNAENVRASGRPKVHCKHGHPMSGENLGVLRNGRRFCRTCARKASRETQARRRRGIKIDRTVGVDILDDRLPARFWKKVEVSGDGCWLWTGSRKAGGYGVVGWQGKVQHVHRVAYRVLVGDFDPDLTIDHLCGQPACVNPEHLEPVDIQENIQRATHAYHPHDRSHLVKTHCPKGHPYLGDNLYISPSGAKHCRTCHSESGQRRYLETQADPVRREERRTRLNEDARRRWEEARERAKTDPEFAAEWRAKRLEAQRRYQARLREERPEAFQAQRERFYALRKERLRNDPTARERNAEYARQWREKLKDDPERRAKHLAKTRASARKRKAAILADPVKREEYLAKQREYERARQERLAADPAKKEARLAKQREGQRTRRQRRKDDDG